MKPGGGRLWTLAEHYAIKKHCQTVVDLNTKNVKRAFAAEGLTLRCTGRQLSQSLRCEKEQQGQCAVRPKHGITVLELKTVAEKWLLEGSWRDKPVDKLFVFPGYAISESQVFVPWSTAGMLKKATSVQHKVVKLVVDGKQNIVANQYSVVTLSFFKANENLSWPRGKPRNLSSEMHCSTQEPFLQALMDAAPAENMKALFELAVKTGEEEWGLNLKQQVLQLRKDYAKRIAAARKAVLHRSRPCEDYAHMRRATYKVLESFLKAADVSCSGVQFCGTASSGWKMMQR